MYRLMYKTKGEWQCMGTYTDIEIAIDEMERLERSVLGHGGEFKIVREGKEKEKE